MGKYCIIKSSATFIFHTYSMGFDLQLAENPLWNKKIENLTRWTLSALADV